MNDALGEEMSLLEKVSAEKKKGDSSKNRLKSSEVPLLNSDRTYLKKFKKY